MALGTRMSALASRLIDKFGGTIIITRPVASSFNAVTQLVTAGTPLSDTLKAVIEEYKAYEVDGESVRYGDKKVMIPRSDLTNLSQPVPNDTIEMLGATYRVVGVVGISSGDMIVAYSVQARK